MSLLDVVSELFFKDPEIIQQSITNLEKQLICNGYFRLDVVEDDNTYKVLADLPGVSKDNISLEFNNSYLVIKGKREFPYVEANVSERFQGEFFRKLHFTNIKRITSSLKDGVLTIILEKNEVVNIKVDVE